MQYQPRRRTNLRRFKKTWKEHFSTGGRRRKKTDIVMAWKR
jgi:hypothetical protein